MNVSRGAAPPRDTPGKVTLEGGAINVIKTQSAEGAHLGLLMHSVSTPPPWCPLLVRPAGTQPRHTPPPPPPEPRGSVGIKRSSPGSGFSLGAHVNAGIRCDCSSCSQASFLVTVVRGVSHSERWSLLRCGRHLEVFVIERWSLVKGRCCLEVVDVEWWSLLRGEQFREVVIVEVVTFEKWSWLRHLRGGHF